MVVLPKSKYSPRDIITQGSGYLQWLSIFCILYTSDIDVLLLDEPDAHLHASLQSELLSKLKEAIEVEPEKVDYVDISPKQLVSIAAAMKWLFELIARSDAGPSACMYAVGI